MNNPVEYYKAESFEEVERFLSSLYKKRDYRNLFFRGQGDSDWALTATMFRKLISKNEVSKKELETASKNEYHNVRRFVIDADQMGLDLPPGYFDFLNKTHLDDMEVPGWATPRSNSALELVALAQHHGVQTRFLDFSYDSFVALYFAAESAFKNLALVSNEEIKSKRFSVWVFDWFFFAPRFDQPELYGLTEFFAGVSKNSYLRAQKGLFLAPVLRSPFKEKYGKDEFDLKIAIETCAREVAKIGEGEKNIWPVLFRIDIPYIKAPEILMELEKRNISLRTIKPSPDNIVASWEFASEVRTKWSMIEADQYM